MKKTIAIISLLLGLALCAFAGCSPEADLKDPTEGLTASTGLEFTLVKKVTNDAGEVHYAADETGTEYGLSGIGTCSATNLVVPSEYNGKPVVCVVGSAFFGNSQFESVVLPNSIKEIGALAFGRNSNLKSFNMGNGVEWIGDCAFGTCPVLETFVLSNVCNEIGWGCFHDSVKLTTLNIPVSVTKIGHDIFENVPEFAVINYAGSKSDWEKISIDSNEVMLGEEVTINYNAKF